ncbi:MAG: CRISPR-associated helicase Cas3' [Kiritimatiellales bacterium]|nr:CRISPR-associated helicase Cas3' [Kiritimatiellales bacterium]
MPLNPNRFRPEDRRTIPVIPFDRCAAKTTSDELPGTTVFDHCRNVGYVAETLVNLLPSRMHAWLPNRPALPTSLHDVGKVSPGYQLKYFEHTLVKEMAPALVGQTNFSRKHASISAAAIDRYQGNPHPKSPVSVAAAAHHGTADRSYPADAAECLGGPSWAEERRKLIEALISEFGGSLNASDHACPSLLAGLTCVADWIGSGEDFFPADQPPIREGDAHATARHAVSFCGFEPSPLKPGLSFQEIFGFPPRAAQQQFIDKIQKPGAYILEAPMGLGKTEAALYVTYGLMSAGHHHGFYFALPTRLTSDRIHERVSLFLARITDAPRAPRLAHGMAWLNEFSHGGKEFAPGESWFNPIKRALLYPYAVGTIDQALMSVMNVKHGFVRLFGLAGKVVILDEVHSYDVYTGTLLNELVNRLLQIGCTVVILSATLTAARRRQILPADETETNIYPLMTCWPEKEAPFIAALPAQEGSRVAVRIADWTLVQMAWEAVTAARNGRCTVCIANTVAQAQAWYRAVCAIRKDGEFETGLLHARFPMTQRKKIEDHWMKILGPNSQARPLGCVLIATQILEQSVDLDADWMISELAPSDMLLQRMGRLWRHERERRSCSGPELVIVARDPSGCEDRDSVLETLGKANCCVYAPFVLMRTHAVWKPRHSVALPNDIRTVIEATYADQKADEPPLIRTLREHLQTAAEQLQRRACSAMDNVRGIPTQSDDEGQAPTRYSDLPTRTVLLLKAIDSEDGTGSRARVRLMDGTEWELDRNRPDFRATRHLHKSTVSVAAHLLPDRGLTSQDVFWLYRHFHEKPCVLIQDEGGRLWSYKGSVTRLLYSDELGIWCEPELTRGDDSPDACDDETEGLDPFRMTW